MLQVTPRALGFGEILDGAFTLLRRHFVLLFSVALIPQIPEILYWMGITAFLPAELHWMAGVIVLPWTFFIYFFLLGALILAVTSLLEGTDPGVKEPLLNSLRYWLPLAVAGVLFGFLMMFGFLLFIIPGLFLLASFFVFAPVVVLEGAGPLRGLGRSWELARGGRLRTLGLAILSYIIIIIPGLVLTFVGASMVGFGALFSGDPEALEGAGVWVSGLFQVLGPVVNAITLPFFISVMVLLYLDRRARVDAAELDAAVGSLEASA